MDAKRILLITSLPPSHSAGLGQDIIDSLEEAGYIVDTMVKWDYPNQPKNVCNVLTRPLSARIHDVIPNSVLRFMRKLVKALVLDRCFKKKDCQYINNNGIYIIYPDELNPDVDASRVVDKIKFKYDAVITLFWQDFINSTSLRTIYEHLNCPIFVYAVDMAPLTGGCYFFDKCNHFKNGCGACPGLASNNQEDASRHNFLIKQGNYTNSEIYFMGNTWMNRFATQTKLFPPNRIINTSLIINDKTFCPSYKDVLKLPETKDFVIMFRSSIRFPRKGQHLLVKLLQILHERLSENERRRVILLSVGETLDADQASALKFPVIDLGRVSTKMLIRAYRSSSVFVSTSIDDAGPSMVNQAMMCALPVAAFEIGTAIDVIKNGKNGLMAPVGDYVSLAEGIRNMISNPQMVESMRKNARESALLYNSPKAFSDLISSLLSSN